MKIVLVICFSLIVGLLNSCNRQSSRIISNSSYEKMDIDKRPNLILIMADQWRGQALSFLNEEKVQTPNLDSFISESAFFPNFISNYPRCSPARAILMSGKYPLKNNVYVNCNSFGTLYNVELPMDIVTWSDILHDQNYSLGYIGKWHLDAPKPPYIPTYNNFKEPQWNEWTPPSRRHGFDFWYAYGTYDEHLQPMYWDTNSRRWGFHFVNEWGPIHEVNKAIDFLKNEDGEFRKEREPFALVVSMNPPHGGYDQVPDKYLNRFKDRNINELIADEDIPKEGTKMGDYYRTNIRKYFAAIYGVDDQIGRLLEAIKTSDISDNTIIIFLSDHGNNLGKHNEISKNNYYEESLRVPFVINWKGKIIPQINKTLLSMIDVYPTILDLMGLDKEIPKSVQGISASKLLLNQKEEDRDQFFMGRLKPEDKSFGFRGIRTPKFKYIIERTSEDSSFNEILYDYKKDLFEMNNIAQDNHEVVLDLKSKLINFLLTQDDPFFQYVKKVGE